MAPKPRVRVEWKTDRDALGHWEITIPGGALADSLTFRLTGPEAADIADKIHRRLGVPSRNCPHCKRSI